MINWKERLYAAGVHFCISFGLAALAALLVFVIWYPYPYREISGGRELFLIVVAVDVILGPLITLAIFNRRKPWSELRRDLAVVALLQLAGLGYGLSAVYLARPVHLVFEVDRFRVVHAVDVPIDLMDKIPGGINAMPLGGPTMLAVRPFKSQKEGVDATLAALSGISLASRPDLWRSYESARPDVLVAAKPIAALLAKFPKEAPSINAAVQATGRSADKLAYLPMVGRKQFWTVLIDAQTAQVLGFMPLDSF